jgi:hypothetical protein
MSETVSIEQINELKAQGRRIEEAVTGDPALGPFALLPGMWANEPTLPGRGWNMIALPFAPQNGSLSPTFRLLLNQYNEILNFFLVDKAVPNRGAGPALPASTDCDQHVVTLDYEQGISQIAAEDFPVSGLAGAPQLAIHHEPGLFLNMLDQVEPGGPTIARLATIPPRGCRTGSRDVHGRGWCTRDPNC